jgi:hypothetical protein
VWAKFNRVKTKNVKEKKMSIIVKGNPYPQSQEAIHASFCYSGINDLFYISEIPEANQIIFSARDRHCAKAMIVKFYQLIRTMEYQLYKDKPLAFEEINKLVAEGIYCCQILVRARSASSDVKPFTDNSEVLVFIPNSPEGAKDLIKQFEHAIDEIKAVFKFDSAEKL